MDPTIVYVVGFVVALAFVVFGFDDLLWDIYALFRRVGKKRVEMQHINDKPPKMLAIIIAAWHEDAVLGDVVDNLIASAQYPRSLYRVFLGVYPNDEATLAVAHALEKRHAGTVVVSVNNKPGPTSKADNINAGIRHIKEYELAHDIRFACVTIHDSEDVVHPNEFKMTNYLIDDYDALQFPVFPLQRKPKLRLFFKMLTSGTYADEFAEHHYRTMVMRDELGFVPSAGTGFAIGRRVLEAFKDEDLLPENSLTEDYKLSLTLRMKGFRVHYVLERVPRVDANGRMVWDYIATRSLFPATFKAAVRQKARWVYGITMQSASMKDVFAKSALTFAERTFLYKDLKAKFANFVLLPGYAVLIYFLVQTFAPQLNLPIMYPLYSPSWWICVFLLFMMVERQVLRGRALVNVYGWKTMAFSVLLPPLFPLRLLWGNLINMVATFRAWRQKITFMLSRKKKQKEAAKAYNSTASGNKKATTSDEKRPAWNKTDHEFLPEPVLARYRRVLGDTLLEQGALSPHQLGSAVGTAHERGIKLGQILLEEGLIEDLQLVKAYALQQQSINVPVTPELVDQALLEDTPQEVRKTFEALPLVQSNKGWVVVISDDASVEDRSRVTQLLGGRAFFLFATTSELQKTLSSTTEEGERVQVFDSCSQAGETRQLLDTTQIELAQAGIALAYALRLKQQVHDVTYQMGLAVKLHDEDREYSVSE